MARQRVGEPCSVCFEGEREALIRPCGHVATCISCALKIHENSDRRCVICRTLIEDVLPVPPMPVGTDTTTCYECPPQQMEE